MQINNLIQASVSHDQYHSTMVHLDTVLNEDSDSIVDLLLHF